MGAVASKPGAKPSAVEAGVGVGDAVRLLATAGAPKASDAGATKGALTVKDVNAIAREEAAEARARVQALFTEERLRNRLMKAFHERYKHRLEKHLRNKSESKDSGIEKSRVTALLNETPPGDITPEEAALAQARTRAHHEAWEWLAETYGISFQSSSAAAPEAQEEEEDESDAAHADDTASLLATDPTVGQIVDAVTAQMYQSPAVQRHYAKLLEDVAFDLQRKRNPKLTTFAQVLCWLFAIGCGATVGPIAFLILLGFGLPGVAAACIGVAFFFITTIVNLMLAGKAVEKMVFSFGAKDHMGTKSLYAPVFNHAPGGLAHFTPAQLKERVVGVLRRHFEKDKNTPFVLSVVNKPEALSFTYEASGDYSTQLEKLTPLQLMDILNGQRSSRMTRAVIVVFSIVALMAGLTFAVLSFTAPLMGMSYLGITGASPVLALVLAGLMAGATLIVMSAMMFNQIASMIQGSWMAELHFIVDSLRKQEASGAKQLFAKGVFVVLSLLSIPLVLLGLSMMMQASGSALADFFHGAARFSVWLASIATVLTMVVTVLADAPFVLGTQLAVFSNWCSKLLARMRGTAGPEASVTKDRSWKEVGDMIYDWFLSPANAAANAFLGVRGFMAMGLLFGAFAFAGWTPVGIVLGLLVFLACFMNSFYATRQYVSGQQSTAEALEALRIDGMSAQESAAEAAAAARAAPKSGNECQLELARRRRADAAESEAEAEEEEDESGDEVDMRGGEAGDGASAASVAAGAGRGNI